MRFLCKIDRKLYACVSENIVSEDVVLNPERNLHIQEHQPRDNERYAKYMRSMIEEPDYIVETDRPKTAFILKTFVENECQFRLILRLHTADDDPNFENSVITFQYVRAKEYRRILRSKKCFTSAWTCDIVKTY